MKNHVNLLHWYLMIKVLMERMWMLSHFEPCNTSSYCTGFVTFGVFCFSAHSVYLFRDFFQVQQFASDVGGAIGLWIGLSIISVFELVQLLLECCAFGVHKCKNPPSSKRKRREKYREPPKDTQKRQTNTGHKSENSFQLNWGFYNNQYNDNWRNRI